MYKILIITAFACLFFTSCTPKNADKNPSVATTKLSDSIADEDANDGYQINAEVTATKNYELLIPDGFTLLSKAEGDINLDEISDVVIVVKSQQEKDDEPLGDDAPGRIVRLLVKDAKGFYTMAAESTTAILAKNEGGASSDDPFQMIEIKPGQFTISHMGGAAERWSYDHTFTYNKKANAWFLTEINTGSYDADDAAKNNLTIETPKQFGKINFVDFKGI